MATFIALLLPSVGVDVNFSFQSLVRLSLHKQQLKLSVQIWTVHLQYLKGFAFIWGLQKDSHSSGEQNYFKKFTAKMSDHGEMFSCSHLTMIIFYNPLIFFPFTSCLPPMDAAHIFLG